MMTNKWRYLEDDGCTASLGLATDEYIARNLLRLRQVSQAESPSPGGRGKGERDTPSPLYQLGTGLCPAPLWCRAFPPPSKGREFSLELNTATSYSHTLRLYTYGEPCALVGKYQEVSSEVNIEYCQANGITINRRPTGGGAIIMGGGIHLRQTGSQEGGNAGNYGQLGVAVATHLSEDFSLLKLSTVFERYSQGILLGLKRLGILGKFKPRNDLLVEGKKIAGMAFATLGGRGTATDAGLFHASLLLDIDKESMQKVLRVSPSKTVSLTTVSSELGRAVTTEEIRQAVKEGYQEAFGIELVSEPLRQEEIREIESLEKARYKNPAWIFGLDGNPLQHDFMESSDRVAGKAH